MSAPPTSERPTRRARLYRFGPRDRTGWVLGLNATQCVALGAGIVTAGTLLNSGLALPVALIPLLLGAGFAFGVWNGEPVHELAPTVLAWTAARLAGRSIWLAPASSLTTRHHKRDQTGLVLPAPLDGLRIESCEAGDHAGGVGVVVDRRERSATVVVRAQATEFSLCESGEQERLIGLWGDVLAGFCTERGPVSRVRWLEWSGPDGLGEQAAYLNERATATSPAVVAYREMVDTAGPCSARHEVLIAVTVDERRTRRTSRQGRTRALTDVAVDEARIVMQRLDTAGLNPSGPLTVGELGGVFRSRLNPYDLTPRSGAASLAQLVGFVPPPSDAGPVAMRVAWDHVQVDDAFHCGYVIREWPRLEVAANWMEPLVLRAGGIRTIAMHYEPVAPSRSARRIDRESVKLASDEDQRSRAGFRIGARHRRAADEVVERESELVAGFAELEYVGFVIITAPSLDILADSAIEMEQVAAACGLELRRLDGRHDLTLACALPVGRGLAPRRGLR